MQLMRIGDTGYSIYTRYGVFYRYFVESGTLSLGERTKNVGFGVAKPVLISRQWMGFSELTNYR